MNTKTIVATLAGSAALATAALNMNTATLESDLLTEGDYQFMQFVSEHGRSYATKAEFQFRSKVFKTALAEIEAINAENGTHTVGVNFLADRTTEEKKKLNGYRASQRVRTPMKLHGDSTADSVDWRTKGAVTPVKNQGKCGSCWSFSTTGSIEGANQIAGNGLISLSEQQLVDCAGKYGNKGCQGGSMDAAMTYVKTNGGLDTEEDYQYQGKNDQCDKSKEGQHAASITGHKDVPQNNPTQLAAAVAKGPVSIAIEADKPAFQHYKSGVLDSTACGTKLDHGVLIVGYGSDSASGEDYWTVKNSWGPTWGESGYIRIEKGDGSKKGVCGINMQPVYPTATKGPPPAPTPGPSPGPSPPPGPTPPAPPGTGYYEKPNP